MAQTLQNQIVHFPHAAGCYLFKDAAGVVLYVGKAKDLRKRTSQYFGQDKRPQLPFLIEEATSIDFIVARTELEALFLENTLIKKHNPKYNIKLKDDKNYAFIAINNSTQIPQIGYVRKITDSASFTPFVNPSASWGSGKHERKRLKVTSSKRGASSSAADEDAPRRAATHLLPANSYFGPYSSVKKIRDTLDFVRKIFPYCANTEVGTRPCFYYHLHRCPGVCIGVISLEEYAGSLERIKLFLQGKTQAIKKELRTSMHAASANKRFELAARLRDQLKALELLDERQIAQFPSKVNYDFISTAESGALCCVNLFKVRDGKLTDKESFVYSQTTTEQVIEEENTNQVVSSAAMFQQKFAETYYAETTDVPAAIFTQHAFPDPDFITAVLQHRTTKKIPLSVPKRGKQVQLISLGATNAAEYLRKTLATDATDADKLHEALVFLQQTLKLPTLPRRIECYDMSNTQGTNPVGSMVVFVDGKPAKSEYRKFKIRSKDTPDDFAMMREVLTRRLARMQNAKLEMQNEEQETSALPLWPRPDLIVIDGGKGQLSAALSAQDSFLKGISYKLAAIPMVGLAKRIEEIFLPENPVPIILNHDTPALQMLQRLRDEAHRFGITFHRSLRSKQATKSALDTIAGIGPKTKKLLKQKFGTVSAIKEALRTEPEKLEALVGKVKAEILKKNL